MEQGSRRLHEMRVTRRPHRPLSWAALGQPGPARSSRDPEMKPQLLPECAGHSSRTPPAPGEPQGVFQAAATQGLEGEGPEAQGAAFLQTLSSTESQSCCLTRSTAPQTQPKRPLSMNAISGLGVFPR